MWRITRIALGLIGHGTAYWTRGDFNTTPLAGSGQLKGQTPLTWARVHEEGLRSKVT